MTSDKEQVIHDAARNAGLPTSFQDNSISSALSETTPLLSGASSSSQALKQISIPGVQSKVKQYATDRARLAIQAIVRPLLLYVPDVERYGEDEGQNALVIVLVELAILAKRAGPVLFTLLQEHSMVVAPAVSLGQLSNTALAASTIAFTLTSVTGHSVIQGITGALDAVLARETTPASARMWCQRIALVAFPALIPIVYLWLHISPILLSLGIEPQVASLVSMYLQLAALGLPAYAFNEIAKRYMASQGMSTTATSILSIVAPLNLALTYILVNGPPPYSLGFAGAPVATAASYNLLALLTLPALLLGPSMEAHTGVRDFFHGMGGLVVSAAIGIGHSAAHVWSQDISSFAVSMLGPNALAAQAVLLAIASTAHQVPRAIARTSGARITQLVQGGRARRVRVMLVIALISAFAIVVVTSNVLLASTDTWSSMFTSDADILREVTTAMPFVAIYVTIHGFAAGVDGMLGALGRPAIYPALRASADCFGGIPLGLYLAFGRRWGLVGLWTGLSASLACALLGGSLVLLFTIKRPVLEGGTHIKITDRETTEGAP